MSTKSINLRTMFVVLVVSATSVFAAPEDDQVAEYLRSHNMLGLLEVQLEDRVGHAKDDQERVELVEQLSGLYLEQLRAFDRDEPYREVVVYRARSLVERMNSVSLYELRIELLIEAYLDIENSAELARLELIDEVQRDNAIVRLKEIQHKLKALTSKLDSALAHLEKSGRRSDRPRIEDTKPSLIELRRFRSLAHYYSAWTGYSVAVLKGQHVPSGIFVSFGWLLGAQGNQAQLSVLNETTLEFEHVARSAIGVAMAYAQSEDTLLGKAWARLVIDSDHTDPEIQQSAQDQLLQILAMDRDWTGAHELLLLIVRSREDEHPISTSHARFIALRALEAMDSGRVGHGGMMMASKVAGSAIEQLVNQGEVGHVLDLYKRFDSLPHMADSFITNYAHALGELDRAERSGQSGLYASVAALLARALKSDDADRFATERDDCTLKLVYAEIRSGRVKEAIKVSEQLIERSSKGTVVEEARWMRIAAIEALHKKSGKSTSDTLEKAVREFIVAYPSTPRSAKLILRHAMQGTVDSKVAIDTLSAIEDDDPIAIPARRALVGLRYKQLRAMRFSDQEAIGELLSIVRWITQSEPIQVVDLNDAKSRLGTIRIGIDLSLRLSDLDNQFAEKLLVDGMSLLSYDPSLSAHRGELVYRQAELAIRNHRHSDALDLIRELEKLDPRRAESARVLVFNASIRDWKSSQSSQNARRVVALGSKVLANQMPEYPSTIGLQLSGIAEIIAESALYLWSRENDTESRDLAFRLSLLVLDRGNPTEPGLRRLTHLTVESNDQAHELEAWLRLLAAYPSGDSRWYEARYESLRVMKDIDFTRALNAYDQYRVLHPSLGPAPWNERIAALFGDQAPPVDGHREVLP